MEYCRHGSLRDKMKTMAFDEEEIRDIASCCLLGLNHLHKNKIIHRVPMARKSNG